MSFGRYCVLQSHVLSCVEDSQEISPELLNDVDSVVLSSSFGSDEESVGLIVKSPPWDRILVSGGKKKTRSIQSQCFKQRKKRCARSRYGPRIWTLATLFVLIRQPFW